MKNFRLPTFLRSFLPTLLLLLFLPLATAQKIPRMEFFHSRTCPHCLQQKQWLPSFQEMYPDLVVEEYEVTGNPENQVLFEKRMRELGQEVQGVPTNILGGEVVVGFAPQKLLALAEKHFGPPAVTTKSDGLALYAKGALVLIVVLGGWLVWRKKA